MEQITLNVEGMSCGNCVKSVETNIGGLDGVKSVAVTLAAGEVQVDFDANTIKLETIKEEIEDIGFDVVK